MLHKLLVLPYLELNCPAKASADFHSTIDKAWPHLESVEQLDIGLVMSSLEASHSLLQAHISAHLQQKTTTLRPLRRTPFRIRIVLSALLTAIAELLEAPPAARHAD